MIRAVFLALVSFGLPCLAAAQSRAPVIELAPGATDMRAALLAELDTSGPPPETRFETRRLARLYARQLTDYLASEAYFSPEIRADLVDPPALQPRLSVDPGPRYALSSIAIDLGGLVADADLQAALDAALQLEPGDLALPRNVLAAERALRAALQRAGYADASIGERDAVGDRDTAEIALTLRLTPGPRVKLGEAVFSSGLRTRQRFVEPLVPFEAGDTYSPRALSTLADRLSETRLYDRVTVRLAETPSGITADGEEIRDVEVRLRERARYTISAGASFSTSEGAGLTGAWTRRNATRRGDTFEVAATLAQQQRAVEADWRVPHLLGYGRGLTLSADAGREETDAFDRDALTLGAALDLRQDAHITYTFGVAAEVTRETDAAVRRVDPDDGQRDLQILSASAAIQIDHADDVLDPSEGWRATARIEPGQVVGDVSEFFTLATGGASAYRPFGAERRFVLAGHIEAGLVTGAPTLELPTSRRFFAGGGGSARGFAYQSIGPRDIDGAPIGGRGLLETSAELRWRRSERLGFAVFVDGAAVTESDAPSFDDMRFGAGVGARYYTPIGPIRLDIATPLDRRAGDDAVQVYISIGQAF